VTARDAGEWGKWWGITPPSSH